MSQIIRKGIQANAVGDAEIRLRNNQYLRARNDANSADIDIVRVNSSNRIQMASIPQFSGTPSAGDDMVNKTYVDSLLQGIAWKEPVRAATTANITLSGEQTIDGVAVVAGDRVLVKNQTAGENNGIYVASASSWTRAQDANSASEVDSAAVFVKEGTANANKAFVQTADSVTLGTTPLVFVIFSSSSTAPVSRKASFTLSGGDITNQYIDLSFVAETDSVDVRVKGLGQVLEGASQQFTVSYTGGAGGNTRISFVNEIATGGVSELVAGDFVQVLFRS